jgi:hypothetical protein
MSIDLHQPNDEQHACDGGNLDGIAGEAGFAHPLLAGSRLAGEPVGQA